MQYYVHGEHWWWAFYIFVNDDNIYFSKYNKYLYHNQNMHYTWYRTRNPWFVSKSRKSLQLSDPGLHVSCQPIMTKTYCSTRKSTWTHYPTGLSATVLHFETGNIGGHALLQNVGFSSAAPSKGRNLSYPTLNGHVQCFSSSFWVGEVETHTTSKPHALDTSHALNGCVLKNLTFCSSEVLCR